METTHTGSDNKTQDYAGNNTPTPSASMSETAPLTTTAMIISSKQSKDSEQRLDSTSTQQPSTSAGTVDAPRVQYSSYAERYGAFASVLWASSSPKSPEMISLLKALETDWPNVPPHEILFGEPWGRPRPMIRTNTRFTNDLGDAISNIIRAGRKISKADESFLQILIRHPNEWSASDPQHFEDPCFQYIQWRFRHLGRLYPILDNIWWEEVVEKLPPGIDAYIPSRILLSSASSFHVYVPDIDCMYKAGGTLEEVVQGLKKGKDTFKDDGWEYEELEEIELDQTLYFPAWYGDPHRRGYNAKLSDIQPFVPPDEM